MESYNATVTEEIDRTATRNGLKESIDYCKSLKEGDYSNKDTFAKLADAITTAEKAYTNVSDTRLNYKSSKRYFGKSTCCFDKECFHGK